jgi:CspA family cold shock protein
MTDFSDPVRCKVKWYNTAKGFGFVVPEDGPPDDWFLHATVLQKAGVTALGEGAVLSCEIGEGMKGLCVKKVFEIHDHGAPPSADSGPRSNGRDGFGGGGRSPYGNRDGFGGGFGGGGRDGFQSRGPRPGGRDSFDGGGVEEEVAGTVKWYDNTKEFGFITPDDGMKDIFIHKTCLERYGVSALEPGQKIRIKSRNVPKGREAKDIIQID